MDLINNSQKRERRTVGSIFCEGVERKKKLCSQGDTWEKNLEGLFFKLRKWGHVISLNHRLWPQVLFLVDLSFRCFMRKYSKKCGNYDDQHKLSQETPAGCRQNPLMNSSFLPPDLFSSHWASDANNAPASIVLCFWQPPALICFYRACRVQFSVCR